MPLPPEPPVARRVPSVRERHGDRVVDEYAWLRDRDDPDTIAYLEAENAYCETATAVKAAAPSATERTTKTNFPVAARVSRQAIRRGNGRLWVASETVKCWDVP